MNDRTAKFADSSTNKVFKGFHALVKKHSTQMVRIFYIPVLQLFTYKDQWDRDRDEKWVEIEHETDLTRGQWEYLENVNDYGPTDEDMDSGDED